MGGNLRFYFERNYEKRGRLRGPWRLEGQDEFVKFSFLMCRGEKETGARGASRPI